MRALILAAVLASPAAAAPEPPPFPQEGDRWLLAVQGETVGRQRAFVRIYGVPDARGGWTLEVTCGTVTLGTGRETVLLRGHGNGGRSRHGAFGGTYVSAGRPTGGVLIDQRAGEIHDVPVDMPAPCPSGRGYLSTGD